MGVGPKEEEEEEGLGRWMRRRCGMREELPPLLTCGNRFLLRDKEVAAGSTSIPQKLREA